jgi:hypothetical protein
VTWRTLNRGAVSAGAGLFVLAFVALFSLLPVLG